MVAHLSQHCFHALRRAECYTDLTPLKVQLFKSKAGVRAWCMVVDQCFYMRSMAWKARCDNAVVRPIDTAMTAKGKKASTTNQPVLTGRFFQS